MIGMLLSALGGAATSAGLGGLGAGLTAAGQFAGGSAIPGIGSIPGMSAAPGAAGAMPFGMNIANLITPQAQSLGTSPGGWETSVQPAPTQAQGLLSEAFKQMSAAKAPAANQQQQPAPMQAPPVQTAQVNPQSLLEIVNRRMQLGT